MGSQAQVAPQNHSLRCLMDASLQDHLHCSVGHFRSHRSHSRKMRTSILDFSLSAVEEPVVRVVEELKVLDNVVGAGSDIDRRDMDSGDIKQRESDKLHRVGDSRDVDVLFAGGEGGAVRVFIIF